LLQLAVTAVAIVVIVAVRLVLTGYLGVKRQRARRRARVS